MQSGAPTFRPFEPISSNAFSYTDGSIRRLSTTRYRCLLLYRRLTSTVRYRCLLLYIRFASPMINGEIPMPSFIQTVRFADYQQQDINAFYYTDGLLRLCTMARFQSLSYAEAFTSPLYKARFQSLLYAEVFTSPLFSHFYIQMHLPRCCTTAKFRSVIYNSFTVIHIL